MIQITWKVNDADDVEKARRYYMRLTRQGWLAAVREAEMRRIIEFKPEYGELFFIPLAEGG